MGADDDSSQSSSSSDSNSSSEAEAEDDAAEEADDEDEGSGGITPTGPSSDSFRAVDRKGQDLQRSQWPPLMREEGTCSRVTTRRP
eukprot:s259_g22.t1